MAAAHAADAASRKRRTARLSPKSVTGLLEEGAAGNGEDEESPLIERTEKLHFKCLHNVALRSEPELNCERTGEVLAAGTVFAAEAIVTLTPDGDRVHWDHMPVDEACYIQVGGGMPGWALSKHPATEEAMIVSCEDQLTGWAGAKQKTARFMSSIAYDYIINTIVVLNAVAIYWEIDHKESFSQHTWHLINMCFCVVYVLEIVVKMIVLGLKPYFESGWNCTDFIVTLTTLVADVAPLFGLDTAGVGAICPVLRLLRLLRLAKVFRELGQLLKSFVSSLVALLWITILMALWYFVCACICKVFLGSKQWMPDGAFLPEYPGKAKLIRGKFSSIPESAFSLLELMTLEGWPEVVRPLMHYNPGLMLFLILFIFVTAFVLLNLVTAVVVEKMLDAQSDAQVLKEAAQEDQREIILCDLRGYMKELNGGERLVQKRDLMAWMEDPGVILRLKLLDWDESLVDAACSIIDKDDSGVVSITELTKLMSGATVTLDTLTILRMQADLSERILRHGKLVDAASRGEP